ncbi:MAG: VWA domain-containing protein, partial [Alphaproteobacteria bacterium]
MLRPPSTKTYLTPAKILPVALLTLVLAGCEGKGMQDRQSRPANETAVTQPRTQAAPAKLLNSLGIVATAREAPQPYYDEVGRDQFADIPENAVIRVADTPVSTFSIDVDTASYSFVR